MSGLSEVPLLPASILPLPSFPLNFGYLGIIRLEVKYGEPRGGSVEEGSRGVYEFRVLKGSL